MYFREDSFFPPLILSGGLDSAPDISAPILQSGSITLPIGRLESDSSPQSSESKLCALKRPDIKRIEVPELPKFKGLADSLKPCIPTPLIVTLDPCLWISTPISLKAFKVARLSSPSRNPETLVIPVAIDPSIMDL